MKCQMEIIILLGLCGVSSLSAMQDNPGDVTTKPNTPVNTRQEVDGALRRTPTAGYRTLQQELQTLYDRIRRTSRLLQRPLDKQYTKYLERLQSEDADKHDELFSSLYQMWANKVRAIHEASYITILLKSYPKTCTSLITLVSGILLAGAGYGGYRLFQYYKAQQGQEEESTQLADNQVPVTGIIDARPNPIA